MNDEPHCSTPAKTVPLLHPVALLAVAVLVLNDHVLKDAWPSVLTGKLSDVAGLVFFPLLLLAVIDLLGATRLARSVAARLVCVGLTGAVFSAIQLIPEAAQAYRHGLGWMQWPALAVLAGAPSPQPVDHTMDPTDLLALPALFVAWRLASPALTRRTFAGSLAFAAAVLGSGCATDSEVRQTTLTKIEPGTLTRSRVRVDLSDKTLRKRFSIRKRQLPGATLELVVSIDVTRVDGASEGPPSVVSTRMRWEGTGEPSPWQDLVIDDRREDWFDMARFDLSNETCTTTRCEGELVIENEWHHGTVGHLDIEMDLMLSIDYGTRSEISFNMSAEELQWVQSE